PEEAGSWGVWYADNRGSLAASCLLVGLGMLAIGQSRRGKQKDEETVDEVFEALGRGDWPDEQEDESGAGPRLRPSARQQGEEGPGGCAVAVATEDSAKGVAASAVVQARPEVRPVVREAALARDRKKGWWRGGGLFVLVALAAGLL